MYPSSSSQLRRFPGWDPRDRRSYLDLRRRGNLAGESFDRFDPGDRRILFKVVADLVWQSLTSSSYRICPQLKCTIDAAVEVGTTEDGSLVFPCQLPADI